MANLNNLNYLNDFDPEEVKNLEVKNIFKSFNNSKDTMDSILKEIRNSSVILIK